MATYLLFLIISASAFTILNADVSLDCGSSDIYSDDNFITWTGDEPYIYHGQSMAVQSTKSVSRAMTTLRVFTDRKKSCYSFTVDKGSQVLVRASFFYGNYDKKSSPPSFDLQFDGNHWATVVTSTDEVVYYEVIYVTKSDTASVCVAQTTPNMFPFISAIEVRNLDSKMYAHVDSNHALMLTRRVAYGAKDSIRFSDDLYDRIWAPAVNRGGFTVLSLASTEFVDVTLNDSPPRSVFENAFTTNSTSIAITLATNLPETEVPIYMNIYFSEVSVLDSTDKRSFELYIDGKSQSDPIIPVYAKASGMYLSNFSASSKTVFSLQATSDSTLPPLINALEVFTVSDQLTDGTNGDDVTSGGASPTSSKKKSSKTPIILGTVIPVFVLVWVVVGVFAVLRHKRKSAAIAAGQAGGANRANGTPDQAAGKMQMQMQMAANNMAQNVVNDFRVNIQEDQNQSTQDQQS
ncbi:hypothetical protein COLO4_18422 [Corchorus olitorius]|uniref:Malectin-like domain-containing protein n=1 Tax=Corchorus olitorius TaxID=93759 RepID=A0A1R3J985_9ROSI|nr:hypothetical protein COLO4_18422 [Corchorus olitorius]